MYPVTLEEKKFYRAFTKTQIHEKIFNSIKAEKNFSCLNIQPHNVFYFVVQKMLDRSSGLQYSSNITYARFRG